MPIISRFSRFLA